MELVKYEAACRAVAAAKSIDEVKEISNRAAAARAYARQAKNKQLELDALEIRTRAERRLGEMIISLQNDGHCVQGGRGDDIIRLRELDIDGNLSQPAQRLARIPATEFESELLNWRSASEASRRIEVPLQRYRHPSKKGDVQRAYAKIARQIPGEQDELRRFKGPDGRLMRDWRLGELKRIESECLRGAAAAQKLMGECPVANADPLATVEMIFDRRALEALLSAVFENHPRVLGDAGLSGQYRAEARDRRTRVCEHCTKQFIMRSTDRAGRFCSRECGFASRRNKGSVVNERPQTAAGGS
jgi:hypothetical protein